MADSAEWRIVEGSSDILVSKRQLELIHGVLATRRVSRRAMLFMKGSFDVASLMAESKYSPAFIYIWVKI